MRQIIDQFCGRSVEQLLVGMVDNSVVDRKTLEKVARTVDRERQEMMFVSHVLNGFPAVLFDFTVRSFVLGVLAGFAVFVMGRRNPALQYAALRLALIAMLYYRRQPS